MTNENRSPLVSCEWLAAQIDTPGIVLLDATFFLPRQQRNAWEEFRQTHLPGAQFFDIDVIADTDSPLPHMLPDPDRFGDAVGRMGVDNQTKVIVYDNNGFMASARAWWTFRVFGHDNVAVLDGGLARWKQLDMPLTSEMSPPIPRRFHAKPNRQLVCTLGQMRQLSASRSIHILDARSPARFSGSEPEARPGLRSGHIPGSCNLHYATLVDPRAHTLFPAETLRTLYGQTGAALNEPIVTTCGSGVTAAILALGLFCLGRQDVPIYDGSWTEWGGRGDTPVETG
jgi:thiosulfate/3-mercaptopyruvate sulfurtransferase